MQQDSCWPSRTRILMLCNTLQNKNKLGKQQSGTYLSKIKVEQTQGEELQADWKTIQEPERQRLELVCLNNIFKVKREECRPQSRPQQTQKEKNTLVAEALVSVVQNQPELQVNKHEEQRIQNRVENRETELHRRGKRSLDQFDGGGG